MEDSRDRYRLLEARAWELQTTVEWTRQTRLLKSIPPLRGKPVKHKFRILMDEFHIVRGEKWKHKLHYLYNRFHPTKFDPFVSACSCCCVWCEEGGGQPWSD